MRMVTGCLLMIFISSFTYAEDRGISFGIGAGLLYSGLGVNLGIRSEKDFKYISLGCVEVIKSPFWGNESACGPGIGWVFTDIFQGAKGKHGLGFYVGIVDSELEYERISLTGSRVRFVDLQNVYGGGITYVYYPRGIGNPGWNLGFSSIVRTYRSSQSVVGGFLVGYQF